MPKVTDLDHPRLHVVHRRIKRGLIDDTGIARHLGEHPHGVVQRTNVRHLEAKT
jgi:hypothetical protein